MGHYKFYCFPGRVTFFNKKYKGRAGRFYIHAHRDSSGPSPLLKNECSLNNFAFIAFDFITHILLFFFFAFYLLSVISDL